MELTQARLKELLSYDPETGIFRWRVTRGKAKVGAVAGSGSGIGYKQITVDGEKYLVHRLAYLYVYGQWPVEQIDHVNGIRSDNRIDNLRVVNRYEQRQNEKRRRTNTSGVTGVCWDKQNKRWRAEIKVNGKRKHLGIFKTFYHAMKARRQAEKDYGFHPNHGKSAKLRART